MPTSLTLTVLYLCTIVVSAVTISHVPCYGRTTLSREAFSVTGPTVWNSLSVELRDETENTFRQSLKTLLFRQYQCAQRIRGLYNSALYKSTFYLLTYMLQYRPSEPDNFMFACSAWPSLPTSAWTHMFPAFVQHVSTGFANFDEFDGHWTTSLWRHLSTPLSQPGCTTWFLLVHQGLSLTDCSGYWTRLGTCKYDRGLSQLLHADLHWLDVADRIRYKLAVTQACCFVGDIRRSYQKYFGLFFSGHSVYCEWAV